MPPVPTGHGKISQPDYRLPGAVVFAYKAKRTLRLIRERKLSNEAKVRFDRTGMKADSAADGASGRHNRLNLADLAYDRLEELIVHCALKPGIFLAIQDLQTMTGGGRTPVYQAVSRLSADTLILIRPRHGLQIAPIDLARERILLALRRDMERFVVRLATERAGPLHRNQLLHISRALRASPGSMSIAEFNKLDRRIDHVLATAAGEPLLEHTLRPLHTIFRRIGWIYHNWVRAKQGLGRTVDSHLEILDAVIGGRVNEAVAASDRLIAFSGDMFEVIEAEIDPALLDCNLALNAAD
jgi:DNA-binding GntR family transcriptional regulator